MTKKIFRAIISVAMIVLVASLLITSSFLYDYFNKSQITQLKEELSLISVSVERDGEEYFDYLDSSIFRFTYVSPDGTVLYDSQADAERMENHLDREEITEAIENGSGSSKRYSSTLTERTLYEAIRLKNGNVLRISYIQMTANALIFAMLPAILAVIIISVFAALVLSKKMSKSIVKPLNDLNLENPTDNNVYEELVPIVKKIDNQYKQIAEQMRKLRLKSDEFEQITASMTEGLILLSKKGLIISINPAARKLLQTDSSAVGLEFSKVDKSENLKKAVNQALKNKRSEFREERDGKHFQFVINRTEFDGKTVGVVILCFDITEVLNAEQNRREFTANVSHELKTPLQTIMGSAELLENGLVNSEDTERFAGNIKKEAQRLLTLINDIIGLSQLDEETKLTTELVELYSVAKEVVEALTPSAEDKQVTLNLKGSPCEINGIRRYLYEIIYNLCDNAIRYNKQGGEVTVRVERVNSKVVLTVADTGIGIPTEHHSRIFERFYRVDKSHSKETGGTGLGLSIVKHAVALHEGSINLESDCDKGTVITVTF